ncbi:CRISPR-associated helicase Cas3' [Afifella sp. H1R]|uniref:CRISPR-associated helicase Cas3' n=1 Tax=Afifella sp. H1R TaxID=2908841 RepID=UPI001F1AA88B|nr:CRISPR-associated helicase Cas3' [Afifella sp. H1R]MCF1502148.1 CRISPR-associated helicase Cas3' [Afifella sp. H1R]
MGQEDDWRGVIPFWGKTPPPASHSNDDGAYKPVLHHLMDVGAVALVAQRTVPSRLRRMADLLGVDPESLARTAAFLAALHDLGKFSKSFQALQPALWPQEQLGPLSPAVPLPHWRASALLLNAGPIALLLDPLFPRLQGSRRASIIAAVAGHHGRPTESLEAGADKTDAERHPAIGPICVDAAATATRLLADIIRPEPLPALRNTGACRWSWQLSGLITFADWIGSDVASFSFHPPEMPPQDYWEHALTAAEAALHAKGLVPPAVFAKPSLARLAPHAAAAPRPLQTEAGRLALQQGPSLIVIEDLTGAGKTEAAALVAARMMTEGKGEGIYFALPTEATANAMHGRLAAFYRALFEGGSPSLVLAHGHARHTQAFLASLPLSNGESRGEDTAEGAFCAAWIADDRRKAFFADVGAGTIDQAFLSILPKKHLTLRQYGLAGRILIIDEAHSFDAYMSRELATLLRLHAMQGGSAIVLSATLAEKQRRRLIEAFTEGLGADEPPRVTSSAYPLVTIASRETTCERPVAASPSLAREIGVERLEDRQQARAIAFSLAKDGAAVLVLVNAVDEAITFYEALVSEMPEPEKVHLFHARFAQTDRQAIEAEVLARFGADGPDEGRRGHILVATQVVEQSLDVDFDVLVSDLAPIDLIIQRAGRIWRHLDRRPAAGRPIAAPRIQVISPDPDAVTAADWLRPALGGAAFVYQHAGIMWRSAKLLFDEGRIVAPDRLRHLIEAVYASDRVPECLEAAQREGEGIARADDAMGRWNVVDLAKGYGGLPSDLRNDEEIGTRLGEATVTLRLARRKGAEVVPWADAPTTMQAWALSECRVRAAFLRQAAPLHDAAANAARADWPEWEAKIVLVVVDEDGNLSLANPSGDHFAYDPVHGFLRSQNEG